MPIEKISLDIHIICTPSWAAEYWITNDKAFETLDKLLVLRVDNLVSELWNIITTFDGFDGFGE
jgi:hypothetical protein